jgi:hypothetical protein
MLYATPEARQQAELISRKRPRELSSRSAVFLPYYPVKVRFEILPNHLFVPCSKFEVNPISRPHYTTNFLVVPASGIVLHHIPGYLSLFSLLKNDYDAE